MLFILGTQGRFLLKQALTYIEQKAKNLIQKSKVCLFEFYVKTFLR